MFQLSPALKELHRGWRVLVASALGVGLGLSPVPVYTSGIFAPQLAHTFHWGMAQIQLSLLITTAAVILMSVPVGLLADRIGVRFVALISVVLFSLSFMALAFSNGSLIRFYLTWAFVGVLGAGTLPITWTRAVSNQFDQSRGTALALCLLGTGLFGFAIKPFGAVMIEKFGWRAAYLAIGALPLLLALPVGLAWFHDSRGLKEFSRAETAIRRDRTPGFTLAQAATNWRFWVLATAVVPISFAVGGPIPNLEMILRLQGFSTAQIISLASLVGLSVIGGRVVSGLLIDRFWAPAVAFAMLCAPAAACWLLGHSALGYAAAATSIVLIGMAAGIEFDVLAYLVARYFGMKNYSAIYGAIYIFFAIGAGSAPAIFGRVFDTTHTFTEALDASAILMMFGALMLLVLGRYPDLSSATVVDSLVRAEMTADARPI